MVVLNSSMHCYVWYITCNTNINLTSIKNGNGHRVLELNIYMYSSELDWMLCIECNLDKATTYLAIYKQAVDEFINDFRGRVLKRRSMYTVHTEAKEN